MKKSEHYYSDGNTTTKYTLIEPEINYQFGQSHSFDIGIAQKYGIEEAIIIKNIAYWIKKNKANDKNYHDGYYWTYNSRRAFKELFPYMNDSKIKRVLKNLEDLGILKSGEYNKISYDRTKWYTIIDESIMEITGIKQKPLVTTADPLVTMDNGLVRSDQTIPDIKPDNKTQISALDEIDNIYTAYPTKDTKDRRTNKSSKDKLKIKQLLKTHTAEYLIQTIKMYTHYMRVDRSYMKNFSTFLNNLPEYTQSDRAEFELLNRSIVPPETHEDRRDEQKSSLMDILKSKDASGDGEAV